MTNLSRALRFDVKRNAPAVESHKTGLPSGCSVDPIITPDGRLMYVRFNLHGRLQTHARLQTRVFFNPPPVMLLLLKMGLGNDNSAPI